MKKKDDDFISDFKKNADQKKNVEQMINYILKILSSTKNSSEREILMEQLRFLKDIPTFTQIEINEYKDSLNILNNELNSIDDIKKNILNLEKEFKNYFNNLETYKNLNKEIIFNEKEAFYWKSDKRKNFIFLDKLSNIIDSLLKISLVFYNEDAKSKISNKSIKNLLEESEKSMIKIYNDNKKIRLFFKNAFSSIIERNKRLYNLVVYLFDLKNKLISRRENLASNKEFLISPIPAKKLNQALKLISEIIKRILSEKDVTFKKISLLNKTISSVYDSLKEDISYINQILNPSKIPSFEKPKEIKISDPYYLEAKSSKTFFTPKLIHDRTGVYNYKESKKVLFESEPKFDKEIYSMNSNISDLHKVYFNGKNNSFINYFNDYKKELLDLAKRSPKFKQNKKIALLIPSYEEEGNIKKTLEKYSSCYGMENISIFVFENMPLGKKRDFTLSNIQLFKLENPDVEVYHIFKKFNKKMPIGFIRKYITEYVLMLKEISNHSGNLILVGGDADCLNISKNFFTKILTRFESNNELDAVEMKMDFPLDYFIKFPTLWVMHRVFDFSWKFMRFKINPNNAIRMYGPASAIKASSYYLIKGYNPRTFLCEDLQLSWLLDEGRRSQEGKFFEFINEKIETNPRRIIQANISQVSYLDMYDGFTEKEGIRDLNWDELIKKEGKGILNVGNTYSNEEIRNAIDNKTNSEINTSLAFGLQQYIDWWQVKIDPRYYKLFFNENEEFQNIPDEKLSKWMSYDQFLKMLDRVMNYLGIEYHLNRSSNRWEFTILNIDNLIQKFKNNGLDIKQKKIINYIKKTSYVSKENSLVIIGHDYGPVGDVTRARKIIKFIIEKGIKSYLLDLYSDILVGYSARFINENLQGKKIISPSENNLTKEIYQRILFFKNKEPNSIIMSGTFMARQNVFINIGITSLFPSIASCGIKSEHNFNKEVLDALNSNKIDFLSQLKEFSLTYALYPISVKTLLNNNFPKHKIILLQYVYPLETDNVYQKTKNSDYLVKKIDYMKQIAKRMGKEINPDKDSILIGSISRIVNFYNNSKILSSLADLCKEKKNIFLLFKSKRFNDSTCDYNFYKLYNKYKNEPWFLVDEDVTSMPEILEIYSYLDIGVYANEIGNAAIEMSSLGVPLIVSDGPTNKSLLKGIPGFFKEKDFNDLKKRVIDFISLDHNIRYELRLFYRKLSLNRFSPEDYFTKIKLAMEAVRVFYNYEKKGIGSLEEYNEYKQKIENRLNHDLSLFDTKTEFKLSNNFVKKEKPVIVWVIDVKNWAFDIEATPIIKLLSNKYHFIKVVGGNPNEIKKYNPDLIFYSTWIIPFKQGRVQGLNCFEAVGLRSGEKLFNDRIFLVKYLNSFDAVSSINNYFISLLPEIKNISFIPNGADSKQFYPSNNNINSPLIIGWVGNSDREVKRYHTLLKPAMRLISDIAILKSVSKEGQKLPHNELPNYYNSVDIVVICSTKVEGGPLILGEAAACGKILVCTYMGLVPEFIHKKRKIVVGKGFEIYENMVVVEDNIESLANGIRYLNENKDLMMRLKKEARLTFKEKFENQVIASMYDSFFNIILNQKK